MKQLSHCRRVWVIAPHPDDEILGIGGLMVTLTALGCDLRVVSVTDGTGSHPGSRRWTAARLKAARQRELMSALGAMGLRVPIERLDLQDGSVSDQCERLEVALGHLIAEGDIALSTWRLDGHPDHEACGRSVASVAKRVGAMFIEYPVWAWHWASPHTPDFPWTRLQVVALDTNTRHRKAIAIEQFVSQVQRDGELPPVLPAHVLARFNRPFETVFV